MNWTKESIKKDIERARLGIVMKEAILQALGEFEHYAKVNVRFVDRLKELGCHAYIMKDKFSITFVVTKSESWGSPKAEFRLYISNLSGGEVLTWEKIRNELNKYDFAQWLRNAEERLEVIESEVEEVKALLAVVKSKSFKCFDFWKCRIEIEDALFNALN